MSKPKKRVKTKLGNVYENNKGYYRLSGNKLLHRKIWEDFYGQKIPDGYVVHHIDENPHNNNIKNLKLMSEEEHLKHHHKGKIVSDTAKENLSKAHNTIGYFRVNKKPCPRCKQGFIYRYQYIDELGNRKSITDINLRKLMLKVQGKKLPWKKLEE